MTDNEWVQISRWSRTTKDLWRAEQDFPCGSWSRVWKNKEPCRSYDCPSQVRVMSDKYPRRSDFYTQSCSRVERPFPDWAWEISCWWKKWGNKEKVVCFASEPRAVPYRNNSFVLCQTPEGKTSWDCARSGIWRVGGDRECCFSRAVLEWLCGEGPVGRWGDSWIFGWSRAYSWGSQGFL